MIQHCKEELIIARSALRADVAVEQQIESTPENRHSFTFALCRKLAWLGEITVDQWWMPLATVYSQRGRAATNYPIIVDYFWRRCLQAGTAGEDDIQETFILAKLLPMVRSNGGRKVFADAFPTRRRSLEADKSTVATELEKLLSSGRQEELTKFDFQSRTANLLGPPEYDATANERYREFAAQLLGPTREALQNIGETGLQVAIDQWNSWTRSIGRRVGNEMQKQILDVLSYECRAAFHTCYSAVWFDLIQHLEAKWELSLETVLFHRLWHLDLLDKLEDPSLPNNRLFHGHIFGLHPACANFMLTQTGCALMGQYLIDPGSQSSFRRLLNGLFIAMHDYAIRNGVYALLRKKQPDFMGGQELVGLQDRDKSRAGRRRTKPRESDAR